MAAYFNEIDPYAAQWLRNLIAAGLIPDGEVDERSIVDVRGDDLRGFTQCHFFAGIGGWPYALRLAGWPDDRPVWTGSCPCQPFSLAGKRKGFDDERHLWPVWRELVRERKPAKVLGEQVASATDWLRLVRSDLEAMGYAMGAMPVQAASAGAFHLRDRYWFVALGNASLQGLALGSLAEKQHRDLWDERSATVAPGAGGGDLEWVIGADGKARPVEPGIRLLAHGVPARVAKLRAFGNAIDPRPAAQFIRAVM
ncbi:DNA cytosine methyltransferase [Aestuariivirga sp.]|uniref:DNA cytosine methyltransferase n=1 Tax=Aestuariivirga sp. TaxID=2650926 RepID=UPI0039E474EE